MTTTHSLSSTSPKLEYYGGKVLSNPGFVSIYSGTYWQAGKGQNEKNYLDSFGKNIPSSSYASVWKEYYGGVGTYKGSAVSGLPTGSVVKESQIQQIIENEIKNKTVPAADGQTIYTVYLPPKMILSDKSGVTSKDGMGGYHGSFTSKNGKKAYYAAIVYPTDGNGVPFTANPTDNITIAASHEWTEAVTDPDVNAGTPGWYDKSFGEIGDIPINQGMSLKNAFGRIKGFAVQKEWSNKKNAAVISE